MALPNTGITTTLVGTTLGVASRNVGNLCRAESVNKFSKNKPLKINAVAIDRVANPNWHKTANGLCGITLTSFNNIINAGSYNWDYEKPTGGIDSPFRLGDFRAYEHAAGEFFCSGVQQDILEVDLLETDNFTIGRTDNPAVGSLTGADFDSSLISDYYFTVLIETPDGALGPRKIKSSTLKVRENGKTVTFPTNLFTSSAWSGNCKAYVALALTPNELATTFFPVAHGGANYFRNPVTIIFNRDAKLTASWFALGRNYTDLASFTYMLPSVYTVRNKMTVEVLIANTGTSQRTFNLSTVGFTYTDLNGVTEEFINYQAIRVYNSSTGQFEERLTTPTITIQPSTSARVQFYGDFMLRGNAPPSQGTQITTGMTMKAVYNNISINLGTIPSVTYQYDANLP